MEKSVANPDRLYDKTHLSIDTAEERMLVHRDYIAHCLRWSHIVKRLFENRNYQRARILDVGCGREMPFAKMLYSNKMSGAEYCGVDMNALAPSEMLVRAVRNGKLKVYIVEQTDAGSLEASDLPWAPNIIVCLEVWEHMHPKFAIRLLRRLRELASADATLFFSTPCWNGSAAANHINETTYAAMKAILFDNGWAIRRHYGTFASQKDYLPHLTPEYQTMFHELAEYYDSNLLSVLLAPLYPALSRNCLWECVLGPDMEQKALSRVDGPWSQHNDWKDLGEQHE